MNMAEDFPSRQTSRDGHTQNCSASDTETSPAGNHCSCHTLSTADHAYRNANNLCTAMPKQFSIWGTSKYTAAYPTVYYSIPLFTHSFCVIMRPFLYPSTCPVIRPSVRPHFPCNYRSLKYNTSPQINNYWQVKVP